MTKNKVIIVQDQPITIMEVNEHDYISMTDMVRNIKGGLHLIMLEAGLNRFTLSVKKWIEKTNAIGILAKTVDMEAAL